jgi:hypothetical protein
MSDNKGRSFIEYILILVVVMMLMFFYVGSSWTGKHAKNKTPDFSGVFYRYADIGKTLVPAKTISATWTKRFY